MSPLVTQNAWEIVRLVEQVAGHPSAFATADAYVAAVLDDGSRKAGVADTRNTLPEVAIAETIRNIWKRAQWFSAHAAHGSPMFAKPCFSPGMIPTCPGGSKLLTYREVILST